MALPNINMNVLHNQHSSIRVILHAKTVDNCICQLHCNWTQTDMLGWAVMYLTLACKLHLTCVNRTISRKMRHDTTIQWPRDTRLLKSVWIHLEVASAEIDKQAIQYPEWVPDSIHPWILSHPITFMYIVYVVCATAIGLAWIHVHSHPSPHLCTYLFLMPGPP